MPSRAFKEITINLLLVIGGLVTAVFLFECALVLLVNRPLLLMGHFATPNERIAGIHINSQGFSGDDLPPQKTDDTQRILILGGSSVFNLNFGERLKKRIVEQVNHPIELVDGALRSQTTASSLIQWQYYFYKYNFDTVFIYHGINDLWMNRVDKKYFKFDYSHNHHIYKRNWLLDHCLSCRLVYSTYNPRPATRTRRPTHYMAEKSYEHNIRHLVWQIRAAGARPVLITFAFYIPPGYIDEKNFYRQEAGYSKHIDFSGDWWPIELWGPPDYVAEGIRRNNSITRRLADELNVDLIDFEMIVDKNSYQKPEWFGDICHFSDAGVDFFTGVLAKWYATHPPISRSGADPAPASRR